MQKEKRKFPLRVWEIAFLAILLLVIFFLAVWLLIMPLNEISRWISTPVLFGVIIGVDAIWLLSMYLPTPKYIKLKIVITCLLLTLTAAVIACWILLVSMGNMW
ncbi:MAG: hypothetical protein ACYS18_04565 [Planctomycetota bacterium]